MLVFKAVVFALTTAVIVYVSRSSLLAPRSHGFYRAFAWEAILILILLKLDTWFRDPFPGTKWSLGSCWWSAHSWSSTASFCSERGGNQTRDGTTRV